MLSPRKLEVRKFLNLHRRLRFHGRFTGVGRSPPFGNRLAMGGVRFRECFRLPDLVCIDLRLPQAGEIVADGFLVVQSQMFGVSTYESFVEYAPGELVEVFFFDGPKHARANLSDVGNVVERDFLFLARFAEFVSEFAHIVLPAYASSTNDDGNIIGQPDHGRHRQE